MDSGVVSIVVAGIGALSSLAAAAIGLLNKGSIKDVHLSLNSRLDALVAASEAKGRIAERGEQRTAAAVVAEKTADVPKGDGATPF